MKRVIIAGGAGFIGSNLARRLLKNNCIVLSIDSYITGKRENIYNLEDNTSFISVQHDIEIPLENNEAIKSFIDKGIDEIYNLACPASPDAYQRNPIKTMMTSVLGTKNLLDTSTKNNCKLLYASTSEVYGDALVHPQEESYLGNVNPNGVRACYDEGKRSGEALCFDYNRIYNTKIKVIRIFNTYGPYMALDDKRVVSSFINQALRGEVITVYGDGYQTRSLCYVDDMIKGICKVMELEDDYIGPLNIGNDREITICELGETIIRLTNSRSKIVYRELPLDDPKRRKPSLERIGNLTGWRAEIGLEEGLLSTIEYFKNLKNQR